MTPPRLPIRAHPDGILIEVWVVPGAARSEAAGLHAGALRVRVAAPAEGGKASRAAASLVARLLGGRRGEVIAGHTARRKQVLVRGVSPETATTRLAAALGRPEGTR